MTIETYERLRLDITEFDAEDIITSSVVDPGTTHPFEAEDYELPIGQ